jgi:hypothetical protein
VLSDSTVTVAEIAAAMGRRPADVEREAAEPGMLVKPDWAGRRACRSPTLGVWHPVRPGATSNTTAAGNTSSVTRAWVEGRTRAIAEAARKVRSAAGSRGPASVSLKARDVAVEAGRQYENAHRGRHSAASTPCTWSTTRRCRHER